MADTENKQQALGKPAPRMFKRWDRPELPERHQGGGILLGVLFILGALLLAALPFFMGADSGYGGGAILALIMLFWPVAGASLMVGMWIISVCMVLREIRLQAYEAAIRGGDLKDVTAPKRAADGQS